MSDTDVLIIGNGVSGSLAALALVRQGIRTTLVSAGSREKTSYSYHSSDLIPVIDEEMFTDEVKEDTRCQRALKQLLSVAPICIEEVIKKDLLLTEGCTGKQLVEAIDTRLMDSPLLEKLEEHTAFRLMTLEEDSTKYADTFMKPTCIGAYLWVQKSGEIRAVRAKETILATGGFGGIFERTTNPSSSVGSGLALAERASARLVNLSDLHFVQASTESFYQTLTKGKKYHIDLESIADSHTKSLFDSCSGGVSVDKTGQTSVQRLRAIGSVACTGIHGSGFDRSLALIEKIVWAYAAAEESARCVRKFAYYFPTLKTISYPDAKADEKLLLHDFSLLQNVLSTYITGNTDRERIQRVKLFLNTISEGIGEYQLSNTLISYDHALKTAHLLLDHLKMKSIAYSEAAKCVHQPS